jgi:hypothetical protein
MEVTGFWLGGAGVRTPAIAELLMLFGKYFPNNASPPPHVQPRGIIIALLYTNDCFIFFGFIFNSYFQTINLFT